MGLLNRLFPSGANPGGDAGGSSRGLPMERNILTGADQVGRLLHELAATRKLVTVYLKGTEDAFMSSVLAVDDARRRLVMDELNPAAGHKLLLRSRELRVVTRLDGVDISFRTHLEAANESGGIATYDLPFPETIRYHHRRQAFRATVDLAEHVAVYLDTPDGGLMPGALRDLSVGGLGADLLRRPVTPIERGQHLNTCTIHLPESEPVSSALEVRFVGRVPQSSHLRVGGRFLDLEPDGQRRIRRFVAELDRKRVKNRRRLQA